MAISGMAFEAEMDYLALYVEWTVITERGRKIMREKNVRLGVYVNQFDPTPRLAILDKDDWYLYQTEGRHKLDKKYVIQL